MARTALDLTPEELRAYRPVREPVERQSPERWGQGWEVAHSAACLLRERFSAKRVVVFGSLTHRAWFGIRSDIDLAAWDIPADRFYRAVAAVTDLSPDFAVDLVDPESCRPALRRSIEQDGIDL